MQNASGLSVKFMVIGIENTIKNTFLLVIYLDKCSYQEDTFLSLFLIRYTIMHATTLGLANIWLYKEDVPFSFSTITYSEYIYMYQTLL